jgi:uroporphyrinogen III methyltransferase/synthase
VTGGVVLNTRPREQAAELSDLLRRAGFEPLEAPAIETRPAWDPIEFEAARDALTTGAFDWVVLASQNAGRLLEHELHTNRVVCGSSTARALGVTSEFALRRFSASAVLHVLGPMVRPGQRVLVPRAAAGRDQLIEGLRALGASVSAPIAYRTVAADPATLEQASALLEVGEVAAVTVCSPSAVDSLLRAVGRGPLSHAVLVCLGDTTAEAARYGDLRVGAVATKTTMEALVVAVRRALGDRRKVEQTV